MLQRYISPASYQPEIGYRTQEFALTNQPVLVGLVGKSVRLRKIDRLCSPANGFIPTRPHGTQRSGGAGKRQFIEQVFIRPGVGRRTPLVGVIRYYLGHREKRESVIPIREHPIYARDKLLGGIILFTVFGFDPFL